MELIPLTSILFGIALSIYALKYRTAEFPKPLIIASFNPRNWIPFWKTQKWFNPPGFLINLIGTAMIIVGMIMMLILSLAA